VDPSGLGLLPGRTKRERVMLTVGMIVLGLAAFAAMLGFVTLCDRV
jgi:hypothetical protein